MKGFTHVDATSALRQTWRSQKPLQPLQISRGEKKEGKVTCLLIQALLIEAFAISAYHIYIPAADPFARKITEGVVKDETPISTTAKWLKATLASKDELSVPTGPIWTRLRWEVAMPRPPHGKRI